MKTTTSLLLASLVTACGGGFPDGDSLGEGTGTLEVSARVTAENLIANASDPNDFRTDFEVTVQRGGVDVTDAEVWLTSEAGEVQLVAQQEPGRYQAAQTAYFRTYILDVTAAADELIGARVEGPGIHTITSPALGAQVQGGVPVEVTWEADDDAEAARIETKEMDKLDISDTGLFTLSADQLKWDNGEAREEQIQLWRFNRISPEGGATGSSFAVSVRNQIDIVVLP